MKNTKTIISNTLLALFIGTQLLAVPMAGAQTTPPPAATVDNTAPTPIPDPPMPTGPDTSVVTPAQEAAILDGASTTDLSTPAEKQEKYCQLVYKMSCSDYTKANATPAEKKALDDAAAATKAAEDACNSTAQTMYGKDMSCIELEQAREADCKNPAKNNNVQYTSCAAKAAAQRNIQGAGFKLNLNSLTLTSGGQKQGSAIFANKDYAKYGVIVGTLLRVMDILILLIGSLAMLTLVLAGIFMIANHGDEAWVTKGKTMMLYAILGMLVALLSFAIVNVIQSALA
ncbi:MAG: hypothetical protein NTX63_04820 [Candidatus Peregrinibacteria bacterium]|nr:hypothetical protein [Candidatus Peregrinibacteria bacterium]